MLLDPDSRGGSAAVHARFAVGERVRIGRPRNHFALHPNAAHTLLLAGGIGITPLLSMAHALRARAASWELHYCARTTERPAFLDELV